MEFLNFIQILIDKAPVLVWLFLVWIEGMTVQLASEAVLGKKRTFTFWQSLAIVGVIQLTIGLYGIQELGLTAQQGDFHRSTYALFLATIGHFMETRRQWIYHALYVFPTSYGVRINRAIFNRNPQEKLMYEAWLKNENLVPIGDYTLELEKNMHQMVNTLRAYMNNEIFTQEYLDAEKKLKRLDEYYKEFPTCYLQVHQGRNLVSGHDPKESKVESE